MDRDELIRQLIGTFREELDEHVETLERDLMALEKARDAASRRPLVDTIFRTIHSLKGAARAVDVVHIETACHRLEEILSALRADATRVNAEVIRLLFAVTDALGDASRRLHADESLDGSPLSELLPRIEGFSLGQGMSQGMQGASSADELMDRSEITLTGSHEIRPELFLESELTAELEVTLDLRAPADNTREPGAGPQSPGAAAEQISNQTLDHPLDRISSQPGEQISNDSSGQLFGHLSGEVAGAARDRAHSNRNQRSPSTNGKTLRVTAGKLDELLTCSGELMLALRRTENIVHELEALGDQVRAWNSALTAEERQGRRTQSSLDSRPTTTPNLIPASTTASMRARLKKLGTRIEQLASTAARDLRAVEQAARQVDEQVHGLRLVPFGLVCRGLDRTVRDLAVDGGKQAQLQVLGADVEIDRSVLEVLKSPLLHLLRNAVEHGIETPEMRQRAGKPVAARVTVSAALRGVQVEVMVADDGAGIRFDAVRAQIAKRGLPVPTSDRELIPYLFMTGFSTASTVTRVAGRGIGLDVVKHQVESVHGTIQLATEAGKGTRFTMTVPLTLSTIRALLVRLADQVLAIPLTMIVAAVRVDAGEITTAAGWQTFVFQGAAVPLVHLADVLGTRGDIKVLAGKVPAIVIAAEGSLTTFVVDELLIEQDIVVKNLGPRIRRIRHISGGTILEDGRVALVLNVAELVATARRQDARLALTPPTQQRKLRILVADDSLTTRTLEKTLLENAGYEVSVAVDGLDAWRILHEQGADLLVSDVEMPRMDGFALTKAVRNSPRFGGLPVILLTSLDHQAVRQRGLEVGANAYLSKSVFDQTELLEAIEQLV